jgi:hypothetical protein
MLSGPLFRLVLLATLAAGCASSGGKSAASKPATCACKAHGEPGYGELDEPALMAKARAQLAGAPAAALAKLGEGERRFGDSDLAEERRALAIRALVNMGEIGAARSRAYQFLERYPNGPYSADVASMTGVHPVPLGPGEPRR